MQLAYLDASFNRLYNRRLADALRQDHVIGRNGNARIADCQRDPFISSLGFGGIANHGSHSVPLLLDKGIEDDSYRRREDRGETPSRFPVPISDLTSMNSHRETHGRLANSAF